MAMPPFLEGSSANESNSVSNSAQLSSETHSVRGVRFEEAQQAELQAAALAGIDMQQFEASDDVAADSLLQQLEVNSPPAPASRLEHINQVLAGVLTICKSCLQVDGQSAADNVHISTLGTCSLGVMMPADEVDVLCVAPGHAQLAQIPATLRVQLHHSSEATDISSIEPDGLLAAPGLRFKLQGIQVKLLFAQDLPGLPQPTADPMIPHTSGLLAQEVTKKLNQNVSSVEQFRLLLRFVKHWARRRGIHGSFLGFFSGTAWAICCARICQMYPDLPMPQLVPRFFRALHKWDWRYCLTLLPIGGGAAPSMQRVDRAGLTNGASGSQGSDILLSVLLPVDSALSATPHVTSTTSTIIRKEIWRAYKITQQVEAGRSDWAEISDSIGFFSRHRHYLQIDFLAASEEVLDAWCAWGRRILQELGSVLETVGNEFGTARPWPEWIEFDDPEWPHAKAVFFGLHLSRGSDVQTEKATKSFDIREPIVKFLDTIQTWPEAERHEGHFDLYVRHVRSSELSDWMENQCPVLVGCSRNQAVGSASSTYDKSYGSLLLQGDDQQCSL